MTDSYAPAKAAYRELRAAIGPWAKANGYRRWAGTQAGWQKPMGEQRLLFKLEGDSFVNPDTGNSYHGLVQLEPLGAHGSTILRQSDFSRCLVQAELDELAQIQGSDQPTATVSALVPEEGRRSRTLSSVIACASCTTRRRTTGKGTWSPSATLAFRTHESSLRSLLPCYRKRSNGSCKDTSPRQWTLRRLTCGPSGSALWRNQAAVDEYARAVAPLTAAHGEEIRVDDDLEAMRREQLIAEARRLRAGIRKHRDSTGHALCWHHPALWGLLPEKTDPLPTVPTWPEFLRGCLQYRESLDRELPDAPRSDAPYRP